MPAKSEAQQRLMGMALAAKRGEKDYSGKVKEIADSMTEKQLKDFAKTKHDGLPEKKAMHNTVKSVPPYEGNLHNKAPIRDLGHPIANTAAELLFGKNLIPDRLEGEDMIDALNRRNRSIDFKSTAANNLANHPIFQGLGIGGSKGAKILGNIDAFTGGKVSDKLSPVLGGSPYKATEDIHNMMHNPAAMSAFGTGSHSGEGVMNALGKNFYKRGSLLDELKSRLSKKAEAQIAGNNITQQLGKLPSTDTRKSMTEELTSNDKIVGSPNETKIDFSGRAADQSPVNTPNRSASESAPAPQRQASFSHIPMGRLAKPMSKMARNTGISNVDGETYVNGGDVELLGKLGFDMSAEEYCGLEKTSEVLDVYSYIEKVAGVPKEVAKLIDAGQAFSGEYLKDMGYSVPKGYEVKGDLVCPVEKTEQSFQQDEKEKKGSFEKTAAADPAQTILITGHSGAGKTTLSRQLAEKLACSVKEAKGRCWEGYEPVPGKEAYSDDSCRPKSEKKKKSELDKEAKQTLWVPPAGFNPFKKKPAGYTRPAFDFENSELYKTLEKQLKMAPLVNPVSSASTETGALARIKALLGLSKSAAADHPVVSSNIKAVGYDKKEKELEVAFHSGGEYTYKDVPRGLYARLLKVKSPGKFFHKHIKKNNKFEFEKEDNSAKK